MKIVAFADTHGQHAQVELPKGDVLVFAGDACKYGSRDEMIDFLEWFSSHRNAEKIVVAGNHDMCVEKYPSFMARKCAYYGITYLQDDGCYIDGIKFWGTPWTPQFGNWAFMTDRLRLAEIFGKIRPDTDVVISHGPPRGRKDYAVFGDEHVGSPELLGAVSRVAASLHIFGHIHESYGWETGMRGEIYANVSLVDEYYKMVNKPVVFERKRIVSWNESTYNA
jgi:Icc-related predicted phosphoesterase